MSPRFFRSEPCRDELRKFLAHEHAAGRENLILPIYLVRAPVLEQPHLTAEDDLAVVLAHRQRWDWRPHAFTPVTDPVVRQATRKLAEAIGERLDREVEPKAPSSPELASPAVAEAKQADLLDRVKPALPPPAEAGQAGSASVATEPSRPDFVSGPPPWRAAVAVLVVGAVGASVYVLIPPPWPDLFHGTFDAGPDGSTLQKSMRPSYTAGQVFTDTLKDGSPCPFCPEMVVVPAGSFTMGSPRGEEGRYGDEGPQRTVTFSRLFAIGRYEVTFAQWEACLAAGGCNGYRPDDRGWGRGAQPVINISWDDAQSFVEWLSRQTGEAYRVPTEAEWEYAARAGTTTPFWTGPTISTTQANYDGNYIYGSGDKGTYRQRTVTVDDPLFPANPFGLLHVHGNVWEWVQDCYANSCEGAPADGSMAVDKDNL